jgi:hypothetical protein
MEKKPRNIFLVIAVLSLFLLVTAYHSYTNLSEIDLISADVSLENDDQFDVQNQESDAFSVMIFSINLFPGVHRFEPSYQLLSQIPSFNQRTSIHRC